MNSRPLVPIVVLAALDRVARESAALGLLLDLPDCVVITHDLEPDSAGGHMHRVVTDRTGRLVDDEVPLEHACPNCTVREAVVPTLEMVLARGGWQTVVLALPLAASPVQVTSAVSTSIVAGRLMGAGLAGVVSLVEEDTLLTDLLGDDLLAERGLALGTVDRRAVGEALVSQIEYADVVVTTTEGNAQARALLQHVVPPTTQLHHGWHELPAADLMHIRHDTARAGRRIDPMTVQPTGAQDHEGVWTLDLRSIRPLHPTRFLQRIEDLGGGMLRGRGHFWLPTRPDVVCAWDGAGGQVSIGSHSRWDHRRPRTRMVVTGVGPEDRRRVKEAFTAVLMKQTEYAVEGGWTAQDDGLDVWLGERETAV